MGYVEGESLADRINSPNGKLLASGSKDRRVKLWELDTGRLVHTFTGFPGFVQSIAFSPDGTVLATGEWGGDGVKFWDIESFEEVARGAHVLGSIIYGVAFTSDSRRFAAAGLGLSIWNIAGQDTSPAAAAAGQVGLIRRLVGGSSYYLAISRNAKLLAWLDNYQLRFWDLEHERAIPFKGPRLLAAFHNIALDPQGKLVAFVSVNRVAEFWDVEQGKLAFTLGRAGEQNDVAS